MKIENALTPKDVLDTLRNDVDIGSANFLDKLYQLHPNKDAEFIYLQQEFNLPGGGCYSSFSLEDVCYLRQVLASWYHLLGIRAEDVVTICVSDGIAPFLHYIALSSLGAVASIINPRMPHEMAVQYMSANRLNILVVDRKVSEVSNFVSEMSSSPQNEIKIINFDESFLEVFSENDISAGLPKVWPLTPNDGTLVMLSHTSGTTGVSKAVRFEHRQFFMGKRARIGRFAESEEERFLSALPQSHSSAISHIETAIIHGIPTFILGDCVGEAVVQAIREFRPSTVAAFPQTYVSLVQEGLAKNSLSSVNRWFSMGDAMHREHIRIILNSALNSRFIDSFGSSELGMALFRKVSTQEKLTPNRCVGRPVDICVAKILDPETGQECSRGDIGLIGVRSPTITPGYWLRDDLTEKSWRNGYFLTGDVGFIRDEELYLIDRRADVISSKTSKVHTLLFEETLQELNGVCDAFVVGEEGNSSLFIMLLLEKNCDRNTALYTEMVKRYLGDTYEDFDHIVVATTKDAGSIPTGATGKVLKSKLRQQARALIDGKWNSELSNRIDYELIHSSVEAEEVV